MCLLGKTILSWWQKNPFLAEKNLGVKGLTINRMVPRKIKDSFSSAPRDYL